MNKGFGDADACEFRIDDKDNLECMYFSSAVRMNEKAVKLMEIDTTYSTNTQNYPLVQMTTVSALGKPICLASVFLKNENLCSYKWRLGFFFLFLFFLFVFLFLIFMFVDQLTSQLAEILLDSAREQIDDSSGDSAAKEGEEEEEQEEKEEEEEESGEEEGGGEKENKRREEGDE